MQIHANQGNKEYRQRDMQIIEKKWGQPSDANANRQNFAAWILGMTYSHQRGSQHSTGLPKKDI